MLIRVCDWLPTQHGWLFVDS